LDQCLADVAACDLYICVVAWRYGFVPEGRTESITELEYRQAVASGRPRLVFLLDQEAQVFDAHRWVRLAVIAGAKQDRRLTEIPLTDAFVPQPVQGGTLLEPAPTLVEYIAANVSRRYGLDVDVETVKAVLGEAEGCRIVVTSRIAGYESGRAPSWHRGSSSCCCRRRCRSGDVRSHRNLASL